MSVNRRSFLQYLAATASAATAACNPAANGDDGPTPDGSSAAGLGASTAPGLPPEAYFAQLAQDLAAQGLGTPQVMVDLDRLDANAAAIVAAVRPERYRIVEKSLPSLDLLGYVRDRVGADRFMVLHLPFLAPILGRFPAADVLVGKPQPTAAVAQFFDALPAAERAPAAARVRFIADHRARLDELAALAARLGLVLNVAVEIDVGLHRGGVRRASELPAVLAGFVAAPARVRFAGLLGYDGHVAHAPGLPGLEETAVRAAYSKARATYQGFVDVLRAQFGGLWRDDLVFNSGGSPTYPLYTDGPVNDVAIGGGVLRPAAYPEVLLGALRPAVFIATPVLARFESVELPYVSGVSRAVLEDKQAATIYGGGWAANYVRPAGVEPAPLVTDPENQNLVPNQTLVTAPKSLALAAGDWIFLHPRQADAVFQFENILLVRGGRLQTERWRAFPRRY